MLNEPLIKELKEIIREDYKINLSREEVLEVGNNLVGLFKILTSNNQLIDENEQHKKLPK